MRELRRTKCKKQVTDVTKGINDNGIRFVRLQFADAYASFLQNLRILAFSPDPSR